jgi:hypothetical protein
LERTSISPAVVRSSAPPLAVWIFLNTLAVVSGLNLQHVGCPGGWHFARLSISPAVDRHDGEPRAEHGRSRS